MSFRNFSGPINIKIFCEEALTYYKKTEHMMKTDDGDAKPHRGGWNVAVVNFQMTNKLI